LKVTLEDVIAMEAESNDRDRQPSTNTTTNKQIGASRYSITLAPHCVWCSAGVRAEFVDGLPELKRRRDGRFFG
jgi:hypothetical protein